MSIPPSNSIIINTTAKSQNITHTKGISDGRKIERIELSKDSSVFNIAAKNLKGSSKKSFMRNPFNKYRHVKVQSGNETFAVNVRSASKRLGLTKSQVRAIAKQDNAIDTFKDKVITREAALEKYEALASNYAKKNGRLVQGKVKTGLKPKTMLKAIQQGFKIEDNNAVFKDQKISIGSCKFYATKDLSKLHFVQKKLGAGSFGTVFKTVELVNVEIRAVKEAHTKNQAVDDLKNEYTVLKDCNKGGIRTGFPTTPSEVTVITGKDGKTETAFLDMTLMNGDLSMNSLFLNSTFNALPAGERLELIGQPISALVDLHKLGYIHRDIKPENLLMKTDGEKKPTQFTLADFGGVSIGGASGASTRIYRASDTRGSNPKNDVFALAKSQIEILAHNSLNLESNKNDKGKLQSVIPIKKGSEQEKEIVESLEICKVPESVAKVLVSGLYGVNDRPTSADFHKNYEAACNGMTDVEKAALDKLGAYYTS